jgi:polyisoprenoid-binding protein YceI
MTQELVGSGLVAGTWSIDPSHSEVGFSVRHLMSKVRGRFTDFTGTIVSTEDPRTSTVEVAIATASVTTGNEQRDGHLRSADFFHPEAGQQIVFVSTGVTAGDDGYVISGDLTINGTTLPVDLAAEFLGVAVDAYGVTRLGAEATTSISRKAFGVDFNVPLDGGKLLIGDKIDITLSIEAVAS